MSVPDFQSAFDVADGFDFQASRAFWLGRCSEIVYPATAEEKTADKKAHKARIAEKALRPSWWKLSTQKARLADYKTARLEAMEARGRVAQSEATRIEDQLKTWGFDRIQYLSGISTQCFVAASDTLLVLCFRGTEANRIWDIYDDLMAIPMRYSQVGGLVHVGFWAGLKQVWRDIDTPPLVWPNDREDKTIKGITDYLREFRNRTNPQPVWITGHSLGGALATLAAERLIGDRIVAANEIAGVYTFGQPRVGDEVFVEQYGPGKRHFRVVHENDVVTRVPPESLQQAQSAMRFLIDKHPGLQPGFDATSRLQYRHVGRLAFLSRATGIRLDIGKWELFRRRLGARLKAPFRRGSWTDRLLPGIGDHSMSRYNGLLAVNIGHVLDFDPRETTFANKQVRLMSDHSDVQSPEKPEPASGGASHLLSVFSGIGIGLLVGLLVALSVSPTVGMVIGGLASSLALILGLNDRYYTPAKAIRIGSFGFACIAGVLAGTYIRTHELLSPSLESEFQRYTDTALGFSPDEAREILKFTRELVPVAGAAGGTATGQAKRGSVLFSAEINADDCRELERTTDALAPRIVLGNFKVQGGVWTDLATSVAATVPETHQRAVLLATKSAVCLPAPAKIKDAQCAALSRLATSDAIDDIKKAFGRAGRVFAVVGTTLPADMTPEEQTRALLVIRDALCAGEAGNE